MTTAQILIVDDELNIPIFLKDLLERAGYQVILASGGEEALARAAAVEPDLAIVDLRMPGMDGLTLLEHLLRRHPELPVLMLTAHGTVPHAVAAMQKGAYDFLTKPFESTDLLTRIAKALEVQRLKREVVERAVVLTTRPLITPELFLLEAKPDSPEPLSPAIPPSTDHHNEEDTAPHPVLETLEQARAACERSYLVHVLTATRGSVARRKACRRAPRPIL